MGESVPMEPIGSAPALAIGARMTRSSSSVYPKVCWRRVTEAWVCTMCSRSGRSLSSISPASIHSAYGCSAASWALISSSSMMRCSAVSTRNIRPGCRRPLRTTRAGSMSRTPTSEPRTTRPSSVTQ